MSELPYRPNVCLVIINQDNLIFLGERNLHPGHWQLPQGGVEEEFSLSENALREAAEELGADISKFEVIQQLQATHEYDYRSIPDYAVGRFRGQSQTFWLLRYNGTNSEITLDKHEQEFSDFIWCSIDNLLDKSDPIRHSGYKKVIPEVEAFLSSLDNV